MRISLEILADSVATIMCQRQDYVTLILSFRLLRRALKEIRGIRHQPHNYPSTMLPTSHPAGRGIDGVVYCYHGEPAARFTSQTGNNLNRYLTITISFISRLTQIMLLGFSLGALDTTVLEVQVADSGVRLKILGGRSQRHSNYLFRMGRHSTSVIRPPSPCTATGRRSLARCIVGLFTWARQAYRCFYVLIRFTRKLLRGVYNHIYATSKRSF